MPTADEVREAQRQNWNRVAPIMRKWGWAIAAMETPAGERLLDHLHLSDAARVLDVATGSGDAGQAAARRVPNGSVVGLDLGDEMVKVAVENARKNGISNFEGRAGDACDLPFPDESFDAAFCRMSVGLFPDPLLATRELLRVVVPGGRVGLAMWGAAEKNPWMVSPVEVLNETLQLEAPPPGATSCFRHSEQGSLLGLLQEAGAIGTVEESVEVAHDFGTPENYWAMIREFTPGIARPLAAATPEKRDEVEKAVLARLREENPGGGMIARGFAWVVAGSKAS